MLFRKVVKTDIVPPYGKGHGKYDFWVETLHDTTSMIFYQHLKVTFACQFKFDNFPVDVNTCDLDFGFHQLTYDKTARINPLKILNDDTSAEVLIDERKIRGEHLPYSFWISAKDEFQIPNYEFKAPYSGISIKMKRDSITSLIGSFYLPTATFSILSMVSFFISPEMVRMSKKCNNVNG